MSLANPERLNRRKALLYGVGVAGGLALAMREGKFSFAQSRVTSRAAQIGVAGYPGPEIPEGPTSILQDMVAEGNSNIIPWGSMEMVRASLLGSNNPKSIDQPTPRPDLFTATFTEPHVIQASPMSLVVARMFVEGEGAGIIHGLPDDKVTDPENVTLTMMELRKGRELWAMVRIGNNFGKDPDFQTQIDELPEGPKDIHFGMLFTDGGHTFVPLGADGSLKRLIDLPSPTAEVGSVSTIGGYKFNKTPQARVTGIAIASPKTTS